MLHWQSAKGFVHYMPAKLELSSCPDALLCIVYYVCPHLWPLTLKVMPAQALDVPHIL